MNQVTDFALGKLTPQESLRVLDLLDGDAEASRHLDFVSDIVRVGAEYGEEIFESRLAPAGYWGRLWFVTTRWLRSAMTSRWWIRPAFASALSIVLLMGTLEIVSHAVTSRYYQLTTIDRLALEPTTRGQVDAEYDGACRLVAQGRYTDAIRAFERFIRAYPGDDLRYLAQYSAGATYLLSAHRSIGPFFPSYDVETVIRGLGHLQRAADNSGNRRINEEAHWLRAKGFLMMDAPASAIAELRLVVRLNGPKKDDAAELLNALAAIDGE